MMCGWNSQWHCAFNNPGQIWFKILNACQFVFFWMKCKSFCNISFPPVQPGSSFVLECIV